jgi:hypothetical protein
MRSPTILLVLFLAVVGGWGSAIYSVDALGSASAGGKSWRIWNTASEEATGHYALAHYLMRGAVPPADSLMRSYFSARDAEGEALSSSCTYRLAMPRINARWWSLSAASGDVATAALTSDMVTANKDGQVDIAVAVQPMPGNWLRIDDSGGLTIRFLAAQDSRGQTDFPELPRIIKGAC